MAVEIDGKTYRNLPEQVEENANNIQYLLDLIASMGNIMRYKGSVATYADLPTEDNEIGDVWNIIDTGNNYAWDGEGWDEIGSSIDLSGYAQKAGIARAYDATLTYDVGDIVYYQDNIYKCNTTISTPEAWDVSHWTQIVLADEAVTLSKAQVISGIKTIEVDKDFRFGTVNDNNYFYIKSTANKLQIGAVGLATSLQLGSYLVSFTPTSATQNLGASSSYWQDLYLSGNINLKGGTKEAIITCDSTAGLLVRDSTTGGGIMTRYITGVGPAVIPYGASSLGHPNAMWKDLYFSGSMSDGTNSVSIADLANLIAYAKAQGWIS